MQNLLKSLGIIAACILGLVFGESVAPLDILDRIRGM